MCWPLESLVYVRASGTCGGGAATETGRTISSDVFAFNNQLKPTFTNQMLRSHPFLDNLVREQRSTATPTICSSMRRRPPCVASAVALVPLVSGSQHWFLRTSVSSMSANICCYRSCGVPLPLSRHASSRMRPLACCPRSSASALRWRLYARLLDCRRFSCSRDFSFFQTLAHEPSTSQWVTIRAQQHSVSSAD